MPMSCHTISVVAFSSIGTHVCVYVPIPSFSVSFSLSLLGCPFGRNPCVKEGGFDIEVPNSSIRDSLPMILHTYIHIFMTTRLPDYYPTFAEWTS